MDRKLFFSYIQNMQQNNQEMTGFQNSMRKNSWQKPKSLYEMNGGGHVNQGDFDREDAARQPARRADEEGLNALLVRPKGKDGKPVMDKDGKPVLSDVEDLAIQAHQEWLSSDGTGHPADSIGEAEATDILSDHRSWRSLSDSARDHARRYFMAHLSDIHDSHKSMVDQDEEDMKTDALQKQGRYESYNRLSEARLRTGSPASYGPGNVFGRELWDKNQLGRVVARLMDPNDDIHNPENVELKGSLMRVINDKGVTPHLQTLSASNVAKISGGESFELLGAPANDPTKTGPGTPSANVDDLRKYIEYKNSGVYRFNKPK